MEFRRPFQIVAPTLDGDVLAVLARAELELTGPELHRLIGHSSEEGVRRAAERLTEQGIVLRRSAGRAHLYRLNREHVAAPWIEGVATLSKQVIDRLRDEVRAWSQPPRIVLIFGSVARGEATAGRDLDLLIVRATGCDPDSEAWREQLSRLERLGTALTGNDTRVVEFSEEELSEGEPQAVIEAALEEGIEIFGSRRTLRRLTTGAAA